MTRDQLFSRLSKGKKKWALLNVRVRGGSKERYKNVIGSKINRSLPDFIGAITQLQNRRRWWKTDSCTQVADLGGPSTFPVHILISFLIFFSRRNVNFATRQCWVQNPALAFTKLRDLGQIIWTFRSPVSTAVKWRSQCLLLSLLSMCQPLSIALWIYEVFGKWKPSLPAVPSPQQSHHKDLGWSKDVKWTCVLLCR